MKFLQHPKTQGFTMVELLIAMTISIIVIGATFSAIGTVYYGQKRLRVSQDFFTEVKYVMQRLVDISRDNTIDYDRYFLEIGPDPTLCTEFDPNQQPFISFGNNSDCHSETDNNADTCENNVLNRALVGYQNLFYWDTDADNYPDRNMGGFIFDPLSAPSADPCAQAFYEKNNNTLVSFNINGTATDMPALFLINRSREIRQAFRRSTYTASIQGSDTSLGRIELQTQISADSNNDGLPDVWGPLDQDADGNFETGDTYLEWYTGGSTDYCRMAVREASTTKYYDIIGDETDEAFCLQAHDWVPITIRNINIESLDFAITPDQDPYLSFRNDAVQVHPRVTTRLKTSLTDPVAFGFENSIEITSQTTTSSRVFGNTRDGS